MVSNKCFRVISRQSFFGRLKKCLKKLRKSTTEESVSSLWDAEWTGWKKRKLFTSIKEKKERRATLVIGKMPKLGNSYNLQREACYEATLPTFFSVFWIRQINKIPLCLEQVFSVMDHRRRQNVCGSCAKTHFNIICDWLLNRHTAKRNQVVNCNKWFSQTRYYDINLT